MKKLITLLLIVCSVSVYGQTPFYIRGELRQVYKTGAVNDTTFQKFTADSALWKSTKKLFKFNKSVYAPWFFSANDTVATRPWVRSLVGNEVDPVWLNAQPYYVNRNELADTAAAIRADFPTGGGGFASDGVYMDGDTAKLGGDVYNTTIGDPSHNYIQYVDDGSSKYLLFSSQGADNYTEVFIDSLSAKYGSSVDTSKFEDYSFVPKNMMKREIAAAQRWADISGGISYGNEVTVGSLAGTGIRNIGADANGKLVELAATGGDVLKASVTLTSPQIYNNTWVQILPAQASGKMAFVTGVILYYNRGTVNYSANEPNFRISYNGSTAAKDFQDSTIPAFLDGSADKVYYWPVGTNYSVTPSNGALYVSNGTAVGEPYGDGTLTVTITYVLIDI